MVKQSGVAASVFLLALFGCGSKTQKASQSYPIGVPRYESAKVVFDSEDGKGGRNTEMESTDSLEDIAEYYRTSLEKGRWLMENKMQTGDLRIFAAAKDQRHVSVQIMNRGEKRTILQNFQQN